MDNTKYWVTLEQAQGIGPAHMLEIYERLNEKKLSIIDIFDLNEKELTNELGLNSGLSRSIIESKKNFNKIETDYIELINRGINIIPFFSDLYPKRLHEILGHNFPCFLYTLGNHSLFNKKGIAILGDKNASEKGDLIAYMSAKIVSRHEIAVISGLARGVDHTAHRSALENNGYAIALLPCGINHMSLPDFILNSNAWERVLIVSQFYPHREANKFNAFIRNKTICALSMAVYIVEAPDDEGILEAAKSANKLKVPLFTTLYNKYPESALGNKIILEKYKGIPVKGRMENNVLVPNMDKIIGIIKFE